MSNNVNNVEYKEIEEILSTLPIGLYAGQRIEVTLDANGYETYYAPIEDSITISYPHISQMCKVQNASEADRVHSIKACLYHEVSHALLTPKMDMTKIVNIFEDERIETILANYYYGTNFKKNVIFLNNYQGEAPQNAMEEFYQTVRYRKGKPEFLKEVKRIIRRYCQMNYKDFVRWSGWRYENEEFSNSTDQYISDIYNLYNAIAAQYNEKPHDYYNDRSQEGRWGDPSSLKEGNFLLDDTKEPTNSSNNEMGQVLVDAAMEESQDEKMKSLIADGNGSEAGIPINHLLEKALGTIYDAKLVDSLSVILSNFNKKNNTGAGMFGYSGVFNPRAVARDDYRFFTRKASINGNNTYGTFHLNLFLDDSGSMESNEIIINKLLYALTLIERKNPNFSYDMITCADRIEIADKTKGYEARGGTHLRNTIIPLYKQVQKPNTYNYNLILFDGHASVDKYLGGTTFKLFDNNHCTIISDPSNDHYFKNFQAGKVILSENYTEELIDNVYKTLQTAFR